MTLTELQPKYKELTWKDGMSLEDLIRDLQELQQQGYGSCCLDLFHHSPKREEPVLVIWKE